jgi:hypothetical protein
MGTLKNISVNAFPSPYKTKSLETFINNVGIMMGIIPPDGNGEMSDGERIIIQQNIKNAISLCYGQLNPELKILTKWVNQYPYFNNQTNMLYLNFSKAKIFEDESAESLNVLSPNTYNFGYNILYIHKIEIYSSTNSIWLAFRVNQNEFFNGYYSRPVFYVDYVRNVQQLRLRGIVDSSNIQQINLYGIFDEQKENDPINLPNNYIVPNDFLYGLDTASIQGLEVIVAYKSLISLDMTPKDGLLKEYLEAFGSMNKAKGDTGFKLF